MTDGPTPTQVSHVGPWAAFGLYAAAVGTILTGPFLLLLGHSAGTGLMITGIVFTVLLIPVGLVICIAVAAERNHNRRLDAIGLPATAEIIDLTEWDTGDDDGAVVELRLSGPGFQAFDATWKRSSHPALRVGLRLDAVVDPATRHYRVVL